MYFFDKLNNDYDMIGKYEVVLDTDEIIKLRNEIIKKFSIRRHVEKEMSEYAISIMQTKASNIINFKKGELVGNNGNYNIYNCSYDELTFPYIVSLIDRLLNNDTKAINEIYSTIGSSKIDFEREIKLKKELISMIDDFKIDEKIRAYNDLKKLIQMSKLNEEIIESGEYYEKLQNLLSFNLVDVINRNDISTTLNTISFFEGLDSFNEINKVNLRK